MCDLFCLQTSSLLPIRSTECTRFRTESLFTLKKLTSCDDAEKTQAKRTALLNQSASETDAGAELTTDAIPQYVDLVFTPASLQDFELVFNYFNIKKHQF